MENRMDDSGCFWGRLEAGWRGGRTGEDGVLYWHGRKEATLDTWWSHWFNLSDGEKIPRQLHLLWMRISRKHGEVYLPSMQGEDEGLRKRWERTHRRIKTWVEPTNNKNRSPLACDGSLPLQAGGLFLFFNQIGQTSHQVFTHVERIKVLISQFKGSADAFIFFGKQPDASS